MIRRDIRVLFLVDKGVLLAYLFLLLVGAMSIYSTNQTHYHLSLNADFLDTYYGKHIVYIALALIVGFFLLNQSVLFYQIVAPISYVVSIILLILVLFIGKTVGGNKSWLDVGFFGFQPSEFVKYTTALLLASYFAKFKGSNISFWAKKWAIPIVLLPTILIILQPDIGSALVYVSFFLVFYLVGMPTSLLFMMLAILFTALLFLLYSYTIPIIIILFFTLLFLYFRNSIKASRGLIILCSIICLSFLFVVDFVFEHALSNYHRDRIELILGIQKDLQGTGYNLNQSMIAIGSGGVFGKGFLEGTQTKLNFVPEQRTDFIFCTVAEEWGFIGTIMVIGVYLFLLLRLLLIAERQINSFSRIFTYCVTSIFFLHFFINVGMTMGIVPIIGIPLPFLSFGGTSLLSFSAMLFTVLSMDARKIKFGPS